MAYATPDSRPIDCEPYLRFKSGEESRVAAHLYKTARLNKGGCEEVLLNSDFIKIADIRKSGTWKLKVNPLSQSGFVGMRLLDIFFASILLICWLPFHLIVSLLIALDSRGGVFYLSERIGKNNQPFTIWKYRTMSKNNSDETHRNYLTHLYQNPNYSAMQTDDVLKLEDDVRVTKIGYYLRKFSLDELPQLWNVLKGDMSLIGPRPCLDYELEQMEEWHKLRHHILPGISGTAQVFARCRGSIDELHLLDVISALSITPKMYFEIALRTPLAILKTRGAK